MNVKFGQIIINLEQQLIYHQFNFFTCSLVEFLLQQMSIFQIPSIKGCMELNKQKQQRIYILSRKKHNPLAIPYEKTHLLHIYHIAQTGEGLRYEKGADKRKGCTESLYPSGNNDKDEHSQRFHLQYKKQPGFKSIQAKRKWIKQKLSLDFQTNTPKPAHPTPKPPRLQSFRQTKAITSKSLISKIKSFNKYTIGSPASLTINSKYKNISLTDSDKLRGTPQVSCQTRYFRKKKKASSFREKASPPPLSLPKEMEFIRTGVINGLRIVSRRHCQQEQQTTDDKLKTQHLSSINHPTHTRSKSLQHPPPSSLDQGQDTITQDLNNYSLYIRKSNSINIQVNPNQRVSRKNILELRRKRSLEGNCMKSMRVTQFNNQSLIKIEKLTPTNEAKCLPKI